jgi:hypothetical protein
MRYYGLKIEMKSQMGVLLSDQKEWLTHLDNQGYYTTVCHGFEAARACVTWYLTPGKSDENPVKTGAFIFSGIQVKRHELHRACKKSGELHKYRALVMR